MLDPHSLATHRPGMLGQSWIILRVWVQTSLSLKQLSYKLCMLLALTRPSRSADLASL